MVKCPKCNSAAVMCDLSPDYFTVGLREAFSSYNVSTHCYGNSAASKDTIFVVWLTHGVFVWKDGTTLN